MTPPADAPRDPAPPLPDDWEARDSAESWRVGIAALRERHLAGWRAPAGSQFRYREDQAE